MTIGYVSQADPFNDRRAWSGTIYKLREAIENAGFNVKWIPYAPSPKMVWGLSHALRILNKQTVLSSAYPLYLKSCARSIDTDLIDGCDALFFPGLGGIMKYLKTNKPFIYFTDATFCQMVDYYWMNLDRLTKHVGNKMEQWTINNCAIKISSSHWAAKSAEIDYGCDPKKNHVIPFGANIDEKDIVATQVKNDHVYKFLFSGVEWERKGAEIAIETVKELNKRGIKSTLVLCGIIEIPAEYGSLPDCVEYLGFLNKNIPEQYEKYVQAVNTSAALILPTKAECAGIVFCEAAGHGLPVFTYDTGGIGDYVFNDENGFRLPLTADASEFADVIESCIRNKKLEALSARAREIYDESLNWSKWSESFKTIVNTKFGSVNG